MIREVEVRTANGLPILLGGLASFLLVVTLLVLAAVTDLPWLAVLGVVLLVAAIATLAGLFNVAPNEARVLQLFGRYVGTAREPGLRWANPFYSKRKVSQRVRNFESTKLKVNDKDGSPIEIAAVVVWRVVDTAEALFEVDDYQHYVTVQSEAALRNLATQYHYDASTVSPDVSPAHVAEVEAAGGTNANAAGELSLRGSTQEVADRLRDEIRARLSKAGVEVIEARISHLAYAPEIAGAMLRRQQANAIIGARARIVEGAVSMVEMALAQLEAKQLIDLDPERRASMVSNLLVVLCGDRDPQPIVNAGTIYS